ncbi:MAG TPA: DUF3300 domain-containing protein [Vicinamibacterales bacterium]|nr:DUF3300 domain-containing protein [Vicinamibacterales bacterium]
MNTIGMLGAPNWRTLLVTLCVVSIGAGDPVALASLQQPVAPAQQPATPTAAPAEEALYTPDQLDSLVAPIALYPDPLLAQTLAASTYPLEIVQLQQWLAKHPDMKEKKLAEKVAKQPWDPSIQAMAALPNVVKRLADDIQWTTELGNAFLAQEADVMQAVQRMRVKAQSTGQLKSTPEQVVKTEVVESRNYVVIEQANPQVVYVPSYDPVVVYGAPVYPYPAIYYPPVGAYAAGAAISFGVGVAMGAAWGGGWGWNAGWGHNNINVNYNNNFNRNANINRGAGNQWRHQPQHRGGTPYQNRSTANRYGGTARGDSMASRQASRQGARQSGAVGTSGVAGQARAAAGDRASQAGAAARDRAGAASSSRAAGAGDRVGQRDVSRGSGRESAFGGGSDRFSGSSARSRSSRGSSSMGSRGGGGFSRGGGGGRGGGGRGGGGRR